MDTQNRTLYKTIEDRSGTKSGSACAIQIPSLHTAQSNSQPTNEVIFRKAYPNPGIGLQGMDRRE